MNVIKKFSVGAWITLVAAVMALVSVIVYTVNIGSAGYFQNAAVSNLTVFCVLAVPAVAMIAFIIATDVKRKRAYYSQFNRSKLNKHVHVFDVINTILMALFCILCVYPIIYVLAGSFNQGADYTIGGCIFCRACSRSKTLRSCWKTRPCGAVI